MKIGNYIRCVAEEKKVSLKSIYDNLAAYFKLQGKDYVTYQRFCNKIAEESITAEELLIICNLIDIRIEQLISFVKMEMSNFSFKTDENDTIIQLFRQYFNTYYDTEVVTVNDESILQYLPKVNSRINPKNHKIISAVHITNPGTEHEERTISIVGYSFEMNEVVSETIDIKVSSNQMTYSLYLYSKDFDVFLKSKGVAAEDFEAMNTFEKHDFIDKIGVQYIWFAGEREADRIYPFKED